MQIRSGGRWFAALACVFIAAGSSTAVAAETLAAVDALRDVAMRVDTVTRETLAAHAAHRAVPQASADAAKRAHGDVDAIMRGAFAQGIANDATFARKASQVRKMLANLEHAQTAAADAALPALAAETDPQRTARVSLAHGRGASCASALTIAPGRAIETTLASAGGAGSELWLRVTPANRGYTRIDTAPTALDTEITLFGTSCPASENEAAMRSDDAIGLAAAVAFDGRVHAGARYARVRNLSRTGRVVARVETAAAILGRVTDQRTNEPLPARVQALTPDGFYFGSVYADGGTGLYLLTVDPGSYYVLVDDLFSTVYVPELYPDAPCPYYNFPNCDLTGATLLTLADGGQVAGINVALNVGARVAGTVQSAADGTPIALADITVFDANGNSVNEDAFTDIAGRYTVSGLLTGTYYVLASASASGYGAQVWNQVTCGGPYQTDCQVLDGTPLPVVRDTLTRGIDFDLPREAHISATVSARDGADVPLSFWTLIVVAADGTFVNSYFNYYGSFSIDTGPLPTGSYRAFVTANNYFSQVWNGIDCASDCNAELPQGNLITLTAGAESDISFALLSMPTVSGMVTDAGTHLPLVDIPVQLVPLEGSNASTIAYTDASGHYRLLPIQVGTYYVFASDYLHRPTVYPDAPCSNNEFSSCDLSAATPVTIAYGGQSFPGSDFAMPADGTISGRVTIRVPDGMTLAPIVPTNENISVHDPNGDFIAAAGMATDGTYEIVGVPGGTVYAIATGDAFDQAYPGFDCMSGCLPTDGDPIVIAQGQQVTGIDFDPVPSDYMFGRATDQDGAPVPAIAIDLWNATDDTHCGVAVTNADGYYALQNASYVCGGLHRLSTDTEGTSYENQVYDGILCPAGPAYLGLCSLDGGAELSFPTTPVFVIANFVLGERPDPVFASGFDP